MPQGVKLCEKPKEARMINQEISQEINAPVEKVFAFVTDLRNVTKWQTGIVESTQTPDGPTKVGSQNKIVRTLLGQRVEATIEVTELVPNKKFAARSKSGPLQLGLTQTYESVGAGTKLTFQIEMEAGGFFKLAEGVLAGNMKKELEAQAAKLKQVLEG
jgi:carbon monoxide dehydrogenase subunit G